MCDIVTVQYASALAHLVRSNKKLHCHFSYLALPSASTKACYKMHHLFHHRTLPRNVITYMTIWFARSRTLASSGQSTLSRAPCCRFRESLLARADSWLLDMKLITGATLSHNGVVGASLIMQNSLSFRCWRLDVLALWNCGHDNRLRLLLWLVCNPTWHSLLFMLRCFGEPYEYRDDPLILLLHAGEKLENVGVKFHVGIKYVMNFHLVYRHLHTYKKKNPPAIELP